MSRIKAKRRTGRILNQKVREREKKAKVKAIKTFESSGDYLFWLAHGCNYFASSFDERIWDPLFPQIYDEETPSLENMLTTVYSLVEHNDDPSYLLIAAWAVQPVSDMFDIVEAFLVESEKNQRMREAHFDPIWGGFDFLKRSIASTMSDSIQDWDKNLPILRMDTLLSIKSALNLTEIEG